MGLVVKSLKFIAIRVGCLTLKIILGELTGSRSYSYH